MKQMNRSEIFFCNKTIKISKIVRLSRKFLLLLMKKRTQRSNKGAIDMQMKRKGQQQELIMVFFIENCFLQK